MEKLIPNTVIYDRFLLREELFHDPQTGQRTWSLLDQETEKYFIVRFHVNGQTEWFADDRQRPEPVKNTTSQNISKSVTPSAAPPSAGKRILLFFLTIIIPGALYTAYQYRSPIILFAQSALNSKTDSLANSENIDSRIVTGLKPDASAAEQAKGDGVNGTSASSENKIPVNAGKETAHAAAIKAINLLNTLSAVPGENHPAIFSNARKAFTDLRNSDPDSRFLDSIFTICAGKGAQSLTTHQQNGDSTSKKYAIEWYQTAYDLKPSTDLLSRLNRLKGVSVKKYRPGDSSKKPNPYFQRDPELNQ